MKEPVRWPTWLVHMMLGMLVIVAAVPLGGLGAYWYLKTSLSDRMTMELTEDTEFSHKLGNIVNQQVHQHESVIAINTAATKFGRYLLAQEMAVQQVQDTPVVHREIKINPPIKMPLVEERLAPAANPVASAPVELPSTKPAPPVAPAVTLSKPARTFAAPIPVNVTPAPLTDQMSPTDEVADVLIVSRVAGRSGLAKDMQEHGCRPSEWRTLMSLLHDANPGVNLENVHMGQRLKKPKSDLTLSPSCTFLQSPTVASAH